MEEPQAKESDGIPFEQFKATMRKLVKVSKADLDAALRSQRDETRTEGGAKIKNQCRVPERQKPLKN